MNTLSASVSGRSNVLQTTIDELTDRERQLLDALQETRAGLAKARTDLADAERARERIKAPGARSAVSEETWRRTVRQLRTFTVSELAAELGCSKATAKKRLDTMIEAKMVAPDGRVMGKALFTWAEHEVPETIAPAPEAARAVRRLSPVPEVGDLAPERGTVAGVRKSTVSSAIGDKNVRQACEEAQRRGWEVQRKGSGHFLLVKGPRRVPVSSTPQNGSTQADRIRRMTRER